MRIVAFYITGCLFCSCAIQAQESVSLEQQYKVFSEEIEGWKKEMGRTAVSRGAVESLLRLGVAFQKSYAAATDSIVKAEALDDYTRKRGAALGKLPVTLFKSGKKVITLANPCEFVFGKDELEVEADRPFLFQRKGAQERMLFSYKESQRLINVLAHLDAKAQASETTSVSTRHFVISVQMAGGEPAVFLQFKAPDGTVSQDLYRLSGFDSQLLAGRIRTVLQMSPPPSGYREPADSDPGTAQFAGPVEGGAPPSGGETASANALVFNAVRVSVSQGKKHGNTRVSQQFEYRATFRWSGEQPMTVRVVMCLVAPVDGALALVGREEKEATLDPGRMLEMPLTAEQKVPGAAANTTVIIQCFSGGRLLKSYSSSTQHKRYAEMAELEKQLPPLYQNR